MKNTIIAVALILVSGTGMFFVGRKFEEKSQAKIIEERREVAKENVENSAVSGRISEKSESAVVVTTRDGKNKPITFDESSIAKKTVVMKVSELEVGQQVSVKGVRDGETFRAQVVQVTSSAKELE